MGKKVKSERIPLEKQIKKSLKITRFSPDALETFFVDNRRFPKEDFDEAVKKLMLDKKNGIILHEDGMYALAGTEIPSKERMPLEKQIVNHLKIDRSSPDALEKFFVDKQRFPKEEFDKAIEELMKDTKGGIILHEDGMYALAGTEMPSKERIPLEKQIKDFLERRRASPKALEKHFVEAKKFPKEEFDEAVKKLMLDKKNGIILHEDGMYAPAGTEMPSKEGVPLEKQIKKSLEDSRHSPKTLEKLFVGKQKFPKEDFDEAVKKLMLDKKNGIILHEDGMYAPAGTEMPSKESMSLEERIITHLKFSRFSPKTLEKLFVGKQKFPKEEFDEVINKLKESGVIEVQFGRGGKEVFALVPELTKESVVEEGIIPEPVVSEDEIGTNALVELLGRRKYLPRVKRKKKPRRTRGVAPTGSVAQREPPTGDFEVKYGYSIGPRKTRRTFSERSRQTTGPFYLTKFPILWKIGGNMEVQNKTIRELLEGMPKYLKEGLKDYEDMKVGQFIADKHHGSINAFRNYMLTKSALHYAKQMFELKGEKVLSLGGGTGQDIRAVLEMMDVDAHNVTMFDHNPHMVEKAKEVYGGDGSRIDVGDITQLPKDLDKQDIILLSKVIHELEPEQRKIAIEQMKKNLSDKGMIIMTLPPSREAEAIDVEKIAREVFDDRKIGVHRVPIWFKAGDERGRAEAMFIGKQVLTLEAIKRLTTDELIRQIDTDENWETIQTEIKEHWSHEKGIRGTDPMNISQEDADNAIQILKDWVRKEIKPKLVKPIIKYKFDKRGIMIGDDFSLDGIGNLVRVDKEKIKKEILESRGRTYREP